MGKEGRRDGEEGARRMNDLQLGLFLSVQAWASGRLLTPAQRAYVRAVQALLQS